MKILLSLCLLLVISSCQLGPKKVPPTKAPNTALKKLNSARIALSKNKKNLAIKKLKAIIANYPKSDIEDDAYNLLGQIYFQSKNYKKAYESYIAVVNSEIQTPLESHITFKASESLYKLGRLDESLNLIEKLLDQSKLKTDALYSVHDLRYQVLEKLGDTIDSLLSLKFLYTNAKNIKDKQNYQVKSVDIINEKLNDKELDIVSGNSSFGYLRGFALYKMGIITLENKEFSRAKGLLEDAISVNEQETYADHAKEVITQIEARKTVNPKTIGVILPLTGKHKKIGERALMGIQMGLGIYGKEPSNFKLAVIDSAANPDQARSAVERLVLEDHVIAVIGSLLSKTSTAVSSKCDELGIPNITLSQKRGLTEIGDLVFRNSITGKMQIKFLVDKAINEYGIKKFGILYPNGKYGVQYTNIFWDEVIKQGGQIVSVQSYPPKETNFSGPINRLVGTFYYEDRLSEYKQRLRKWRNEQNNISSRTLPPDDLLPPIVDFKALFIPDNIRAVTQIAPTLSYLDIKGVKLMGTNLWNHKSLIKRANNQIKDSLFVDSITKGPKFKSTFFYKEFSKLFQTKATLFDAQVYDTALLLRSIIITGSRTREEVALALSNISNFEGAIGSLSINNKREIVRPLVGLTLKDGKIIIE